MSTENESIYPALVAWEVWNFMSLEHARFDFDTRNIINIKGYNDSGKSAALRALDVLFYNISPNKQVDFIQDGKEYFRVAAYFSDGICVIRDKYINGQSLYEMYKGETCIFTTKSGKTLTRVSEVPQPIQDYLGLLSYESIRLNSRTCFEKQIGVQTTGSENFKMFNTVLKSEELASASNMLNNDKNKLVADMNSVEADLRACSDMVALGAGLTDSMIQYMESCDSYLDTAEKMEGNIAQIKSNLESLANIPDLPEVPQVDIKQMASLMDISGTMTSIDSLPEYPEVPTLSYNELASLYTMYLTQMKLNELEDVPEISEVSCADLNLLSTMRGILSELQQLADEEANINKQLQEQADIITSAEEEIKALGVAVVRCPNCGNLFSADECHVD